METLDLYKERRPYTVILEVKGGKQTFKIPTELTVEESERLFETEIKAKELEKEDSEDKEKLELYFNSLLEYVLILLEHYQPKLTMTDLKKILTMQEAIKIFDFFKKQRFIHLMGLDDQEEEAEDVKKKRLKMPASN